MFKKTQKTQYSAMQNIGWMFQNAEKFGKSVLFWSTGSVLVSLALNLVELWIAPQILRNVEEGAPILKLLITIGLFSGALFLLTGVKRYIEVNSIWGRIGIRVGISMLIQEKMNRTSYPNMLDTRGEALRNRAQEAVSSNQVSSEHIWTSLADFLTHFFGFLIYLTILSHLNPMLLVVVTVTTVISFLISLKTERWRYDHREEEAELDKKERYIRQKSESVELAKEIRIFGLAEWLQDIYDSILKSYEIFIRKSERYRMIGSIAEVFFSILRNGLAYYFLIRMTIRENLPASTFLLYFTAISGFTTWITGILRDFLNLRKEGLELNAIRDYLEMEEPFRFEGGEPIPELSSGCRIDLEHVSYRYPDTDRDTIQDMNLTIHPGERIAIVGLNGAGKTTLVKLICGLLDPTEGVVRLNGADIRQFNRREYYRCFATVFQDFSVMDISIAENVAQNVENYNRKRVAEVLDYAGLSAKIQELPKGMDTRLGSRLWEDGVDFSGGQVQKLMLARALYRNAPILLLDEPTAALDPLAENDMYLRYHEMTKGKTALFVSHRLASTRFCDRILLLADGKIREEGTHELLLRKNGEYAKLFEVQSRYYQEGGSF